MQRGRPEACVQLWDDSCDSDEPAGRRGWRHRNSRGGPWDTGGLGSDPLSQGRSEVPERGTERHCTSRAAGRAGRESRAVTSPHGPGLCAAFGRVRAWAAVRSLTHRLPWDREGKTAPMTNAPNTMTYCHAMSSRSRSTLTGLPKAPHSPEVNRTSPS